MIISVLQWNILFTEDIHGIAAFLKAHPADIICLQELTIDYPTQRVKDTPRFIAQQLGYNYFAKDIPLKKTDGQIMNLGNGIFSRFPIVSTRLAWINETGQGGSDDERRAYLEVTLKIPGGEVTVATTHLSFIPYFKNTPRKEREAGDLMTETTRHKTHFIFTGDLNATPDSSIVQAISRHLKNAGPEFGQKTWTTKPFSYMGFEETKRNWRLDYVLITKDIQVVSAEILETNYSDHLPILAKLEILN